MSIGSKVVKKIDIGSKGKKKDKGKKDSKGKSEYEFNIDIGSINIEFIFNIEQLARERIGSGQSSGGEPNTTGKSKITSSTIADYVTIATGAFALFGGLGALAKAFGNKEQSNNSTSSTTDSPGSVLYITGDALIYGTTSTTPPGSTAGNTGNASNDTATLAEKTNESLLQIAEYFFNSITFATTFKCV